MSDVLPISSVVRPRAIGPRSDGPQLLEDVIAPFAEQLTTGLIWLVGGPGSGKSTAINFLKSRFADDTRLIFFDEPPVEQVREASRDGLVVAAALSPAGAVGIVLRLMAWECDDLVEYLHATGRPDCNAILSRMVAAGPRTGAPEVACVLLEQFAADPSLTNPDAAFRAEIRSYLSQPHEFTAVALYCLAALSGNSSDVASAAKVLRKIACPQNIVKLLRHNCVQLPIAAERLAQMIATPTSLRVLTRPLPGDLIAEAGFHCRNHAKAVSRLLELLASRNTLEYQPMAASILRHADPAWRPAQATADAYNFAKGCFDNVDWPEVSLTKADVREADFTNSNLRNGDFIEANATSARFTAANLRGARLSFIRATCADFGRADLSSAKLPRAELAHAIFANADVSDAILVGSDLAASDLRDANFTRADLSAAKLRGARLDGVNFTDANLDAVQLAHADLRTATLDGACLDDAEMSHVQLEDVVVRSARWRRVRLGHAHLTGSRLLNADLAGAVLVFAHLAEIDWPDANLAGANLQGASFHMGSSRSGLVGSPIACEGSKTGFYTDEREEVYFKRPEEIRKANLCGADLRGANIANVDFYLVDLRGAKLDPDQLAQAQQTGAILDDWQGP